MDNNKVPDKSETNSSQQSQNPALSALVSLSSQKISTGILLPPDPNTFRPLVLPQVVLTDNNESSSDQLHNSESNAAKSATIIDFSLTNANPILPVISNPEPLSSSTTTLEQNGQFLTDFSFNVNTTIVNEPKSNSTENHEYTTIQPYWFYSKIIQDRLFWFPFSLIDSQRLEQAHLNKIEVISTNGNRYDVNLTLRKRIPVYWTGTSNDVRRSLWFYKSEYDIRFMPFDEETNDLLENVYKKTCTEKIWHTKHEINGETLVFHSPSLMAIHRLEGELTEYTSFSTGIPRTRILKRGLPDELTEDIEEGEKEGVQHLCFVVHGIGEGCDARFRPLVDCVDDFRFVSQTIAHNHFKPYLDEGQIDRVEFLPVYWHGDLHLEATGVDGRLTPITLPSVPKMRNFTNGTLLDILFYTSPVYCQKIISRVISEMNRLYDIFLQRNPSFKGQVSVIGHSLGSVILYDVLVNQVSNQDDPQLEPTIAHGSPIAMFLTVRGINSLAQDYELPTCKGLFNIFHPYDPVAYRIEPLIDPSWTCSPVLMEHHKGRKRMHLGQKVDFIYLEIQIVQNVALEILYRMVYKRL
ncbi:unnamed protein product, partial [Didymodactylos carnosus]